MSVRYLQVLSRGDDLDAATLYGSNYYGDARKRLKDKKLEETMANYIKRERQKDAVKGYLKMLGRGK